MNNNNNVAKLVVAYNKLLTSYEKLSFNHTLLLNENKILKQQVKILSSKLICDSCDQLPTLCKICFNISCVVDSCVDCSIGINSTLDDCYKCDCSENSFDCRICGCTLHKSCRGENNILYINHTCKQCLNDDDKYGDSEHL